VLAALQRGVLVLTSGPDSNVVAITPPLVISTEQLEFAIDVVRQAVTRVARV